MTRSKRLSVVASVCLACSVAFSAMAFEGKIEATLTLGNKATSLLYTIGTNSERIEVTGSDSPEPIDIVDLKSGGLILLFPHNHTFMRLKSQLEAVIGQPRPSAAITMPVPAGGIPPGIGPQPPLTLGAPSRPPMPAMPRPPSRTIELKATGKKESILGYPCEQFEIKNSGETMEIWATGDLLPFQPYIRSEPPRFGPRQLAEQWPELLAAKKLFPLRAILSSAGGAERYRFEVKSIMKGAIANKDDKLFQPPEGDAEVQPFPF